MSIGLITPLHNEIDSIIPLFESIASQTVDIECWIILENGSTDGSKELLKEIKKPKNVKQMKVFYDDSYGKAHELGFKYSRIIKSAFDELLSLELSLDYVGILDSDCFPEMDYYKKLTDFLKSNKKVGITSGRIYLDGGKLDQADPNWVRGGCRLWSKACFDKSGYLIGPSADAISSALADMSGWKSVVCKEAKVYSREVGINVNYKYYGYASYYRGTSVLYALMKSFYLLFKNPKNAVKFFLGYFHSLFNREEKIGDIRVRNYFSKYLSRKIKN
ncbi:glycosyltransferase family 2 protein [Pseudoalteromonas sp. SCSIO 43210]